MNSRCAQREKFAEGGDQRFRAKIVAAGNQKPTTRAIRLQLSNLGVVYRHAVKEGLLFEISPANFTPAITTSIWNCPPQNSLLGT
jgi:hypothetical protein